MTHADYEQQTCIDNTIHDIEASYDNNDENSSKTLYNKIIEFINTKVESGDISSYEVCKENIALTLSSGIIYVYTFNIDKELKSGNSDRTAETCYYNDNAIILSANYSANSNTILTMDPYTDELSNAEFDNAATTVANSRYDFNFNDNMDNSEVSIELLKNLYKYNVIILNGHGGYSESLHSFFDAGIDISESNNIKYSADISSGRIITTSSGKYGVTSKFFDKYYDSDDFADCLVYLGCCHGMDDNVLSQTFLNKGVDAVLGYKNSVNSGYDAKMVKTIFDELASDTSEPVTVIEALNTAKKENGSKDDTYSHWYDWLLGKYEKEENRAELCLNGKWEFNLNIDNSKDLTNLSFENNLNRWKYSGDARIITKLSNLTSKNGNNMCIIGTGLGAEDDSHSYIERTFTTNGAKQLTFWCNFISEEPDEFVGSEYDDTCIITTTDEDRTTSYEEKKYTVNTVKWEYLDDNVFNGGDETTYHTDWEKVTIDLSKFSSNKFTIKFYIYDIGDSSYDSALLIDDLQFIY